MSQFFVVYSTDIQTHVSERVNGDRPTDAVQTVVNRNELFADVPNNHHFDVYELPDPTTVSRGDVHEDSD